MDKLKKLLIEIFAWIVFVAFITFLITIVN